MRRRVTSDYQEAALGTNTSAFDALLIKQVRATIPSNRACHRRQLAHAIKSEQAMDTNRRSSLGNFRPVAGTIAQEHAHMKRKQQPLFFFLDAFNDFFEPDLSFFSFFPH